MNKMTKMFRRLLEKQEGQGMVEYALILVLVSIAAIAMLLAIGTNVTTVFTDIGTALTGVAP